ncbi:helix-turn-helix domain-containing protein [Alteromonas oceanisediminis]|uniref:helix-turn-helix domain-containing protein n=1 Tax=Alteromonas oceanisediminis TaxID=2836180 RepID=UPI001BD939E1|nr:helix-turn-helix domain-containing protein [Alteromonas oceanisediminis]MBT0587075.1 AraC family transcriptional regulator [Alteromonas oceanisediminis]
MIINLKPHSSLSRYILSYRIINDLQQEYADVEIETCPQPVGILTLNYGDPTLTESGVPHFRVSLLGIQTQVRKWFPQAQSYFIMILLTPVGMTRLFDEFGGFAVNHLEDVTSAWSVSKVNSFYGSIRNPFCADSVKLSLDSWFSHVFTHSRGSRLKVSERIAGAISDSGAAVVGTSVRTIQRDFKRYVGVTFSQYTQMVRIGKSVRNAANKEIDASIADFYDDSHAIREWNRYLGRTPRHYSEKQCFLLQNAFNTSFDPTIFYL